MSIMKYAKKRFGKTTKKIRKGISKRIQKFRRHKSRKKYIPLALAIFIVISTLAGALYVQIGPGQTASRLVTFHDRGEDHVILTSATNVRDALKDAKITVDAKDIVEPAIDSQLLSTDSAVIIYRARPVLVADGAFREKVLTPAQSPNEIAAAINIDPISEKDKTTFSKADFLTEGANVKLTIERAVPEVIKPVFGPTAQTLTPSKGAQIYVDGAGVAHRETYYDLPMNIVIGACGGGDYSIRYDGAKIDKDGYVLVAASYNAYPKCSVVETSMGPGKVYDTGGFALRYPHGFDLATDWTNRNGR